jgi:VCBS repeat protein
MIALPPLVQAPELARIQSLELAAGSRADVATLADTDGDGRREVVLALHEEGRDFARRLEIWRAAAEAPLARAESLPLTPDVVAFALGDVLAGAGDELLLFNAGGVFVWRSGPESRPERLLACDFLWQTADPEEVFEWRDGLRDLDGDGLLDLCVPEPGGFRIALQRRPRPPEAPWGVVSRVRVPVEPVPRGKWAGEGSRRGRLESQRSNGSFELGFRVEGDGEGKGGGTLVSVNESVPAPAWLDWDGDRDLDLLVQGAHQLHVWLQDEAGSFPAAPQLSLTLPVAADDVRELDASYSAHAVDLDLDRRADCVIFAGDKRAKDVRAQALFFAQAAVTEGPPLFGAAGRPSSLLVFAGFVADPVFDDLDGDGYPELVLHAVRPDLIDQIRSASSETIDADLYVYRNRRGVLEREPAVARRHPIPLREFQLRTVFLGDLNGDDLDELLVRDEPGKVRILMLRASGGGAGKPAAWSLLEKPLWELNVSAEARLELAAPRPGERPSLFVLEPAQVLWVRF